LFQFYFHYVSINVTGGVPRGVEVGVFKRPDFEIPKTLQNCANLNAICEKC